MEKWVDGSDPAPVLGASMALAWCFADRSTDETRRVQDVLASGSAVVPGLWPLEIANVLVLSERKGRITTAKREALMGFFDRLPIEIDVETASRGRGEIAGLAVERGLTVYDAAYLELAMRLGLPLATLDAELGDAARAAGAALA